MKTTKFLLAAFLACTMLSTSNAQTKQPTRKEQICYMYSKVSLQLQEVLKTEEAEDIEERIISDEELNPKQKAFMLNQLYFVENRKNLSPETLKQLSFMECLGQVI